MKNVILKVLLAITPCITFAYADLHARVVPSEVSRAVDYIYELGRHNADSGGISSIALYHNNGLAPFHVLKRIMTSRTYAGSIAETTCHDLNINDCVRMVIERRSDISPNYGFSSIFDFISNLQTWEMEDAYWNSSLITVHNFAATVLRNGYKVYNFGYDHVADVFTIVYISSDYQTVLVFTGDYGA